MHSLDGLRSLHTAYKAGGPMANQSIVNIVHRTPNTVLTCLFDGHRLRQVAWLVDVLVPTLAGDLSRQELQRNRRQQGLQEC